MCTRAGVGRWTLTLRTGRTTGSVDRVAPPRTPRSRRGRRGRRRREGKGITRMGGEAGAGAGPRTPSRFRFWDRYAAGAAAKSFSLFTYGFVFGYPPHLISPHSSLILYLPPSLHYRICPSLTLYLFLMLLLSHLQASEISQKDNSAAVLKFHEILRLIM
ncbi:hypothetical protein B0H13DRAFT_2010009 [Mycena leptocephala]|nr:hypothetical protein B0H13DRAFT_2010009 [Mycena leptocephala]